MKLNLDIKVFLQGPYVSGTRSMRTSINDVLPKDQPYGSEAPYYNIGRASMKDKDAVDWVLVKLRSVSNDPMTTVLVLSGLLLKDGSIKFMQSQLNNDQILLDLTIPYEITVQHRNHLGIASPNLVSFSGNILSFDFTTQDSLSGLFSGPGQVQSTDGVYSMVAGDVSKNEDINANDISELETQVGQSGYISGDVNMYGVVDDDDLFLVKSNLNKISAVKF